MDDQIPRPQLPLEPTPQPTTPDPWQPQQTTPLPVTPPLPVDIEAATFTPVSPAGPDRPDIFVPPLFQPPAPKKSHKKRLAIIIAAVLVVLIGGGAAAYAFWYQNPEKVVTDGIVHAMQAKSIQYTGSLTTDAGTSKVKVALTGTSVANAQDVTVKVTFPVGDKDTTLEGEGTFDSKSDLYVKFKNLDTTVASLRADLDAVERTSFDKVIAKINNQWIKITVSDLSGFSVAASKTQSCTGDAIKRYSSDAAAIAEVTDAYKKNKFITIDQNLGSKDGSLGYTLTDDTAKAKAFVADLKNTKIYTSLHACDDSFSLDEHDITGTKEDGVTTHAEIWVSRFTHEITKIAVGTNSDAESTKTDMLFEPKFNTGATVQTPEQSTTLDQLKTDIEALVENVAASSVDDAQLKA